MKFFFFFAWKPYEPQRGHLFEKPPGEGKEVKKLRTVIWTN